jgi:ferredoxin
MIFLFKSTSNKLTMKKYILKITLGIVASVFGFSANAQCPSVACPTNVTVNNTPGNCDAVVNYTAPVGVDLCNIGTLTFNYTGALQTFTVPAGITSVTIEAWGAQGQGGNGGLGGYVKGDMIVTPGQVLNIYVGDQNGYNGGGIGHAATPRNGGGASDVRTLGTTLNDRVIVAGGGGSSSGDGNYLGGHGGGGTLGANYAGGGGGLGYSGGNGTNGGLTGGTGATAFHAGGGGGGGFTSGGGRACQTGYNGGSCGTDGALGLGGNGDIWENGICFTNYGGTSGGGGGYYGGGGTSTGNCGAGSGGGGSSFSGTLTNLTFTGGNKTGDGEIVITYAVTPAPVTTTQIAGLGSGATYPVGTTTETYQATNIYGTVTCSFTVTVVDTEAPVADLATLTDATSQCTVASITAPTATDNCGTINGTTLTTFPITAQGTTTITWTYDDGNGNTSTQTQDVVITDVTAPVEDVVTLVDATGQCSVTPTAPTATDNCAGTVTGTTTTTFPITAQGTTTITWTYVDGNGNSSTQTQDVVITDVTAPVEDVATLTDATDQCSVAAITAPTATDNCVGTVTGTTTTTFPITTQGTTTITWTYVDGNGNTSTQTQDVVITDVTAPVEDVAVLIDATDPCSVATITAPTATDNCAGSVTGTTTSTFPIISTTTITWTYVDGNGNSSTQTQDVVITDVTAPVEDVATLTDATDQCSVAAITAPTATDNCAGAVTGTTTTTFPITAQGTTTITWTYVDAAGNSSTQTQDVVITDVTAPVEDIATLVDSVSECDVTPLAPTATDNCAGAVTGTTTTTFPITASGTTTITWTYVDGNGNSSTQTQDVVITPIDTTVTLSGDTMTANATGYTYQWVDCDNGNTPVAGATNQSFIPTTGGNYAVEISNGDCMYMSDCDLSHVSVNENNILSTINIYPNPANDFINVSMANGGSSVNFTLLSIDGKVVYQLNNVTDKKVVIDISNNSKGIYFLKVSTDNDSKVYKVIKQ